MSLKITAELKDHAVKHLGVAANADDAAVSTAVYDAILEGKITRDQVKQLTGSDGEARVRALVKDELNGFKAAIVGDIQTILHTALGTKAAGGDGASATDGANTQAAGSAQAGATGELNTKATQVGGDNAAAGGHAANLGLTNAPKSTSAEAAKAFAAAGQTGQSGAGAAGDPHAGTDVANPLKSYDCSRKSAFYSESSNPRVAKAFGNSRVINGSPGAGFNGESYMRPMDHPSAADLAVAGAWFKRSLSMLSRKHPGAFPHEINLNDHEKALCDYAIRNLPFTGGIRFDAAGENPQFAITNRKMTDWEVKALLDDSTSGGLEAVPIAFDDLVILTPLLHGEFFPFVNVINVARGRRMEGYSMSNPTMSWGGAEGTAVGLFNTDSMIAAFDTTIFQVDGALEYGNYFEDDSPVNNGAIIMRNYGERFKAELDRVIATGNGTSEPEGLINASLTAVNSTNGSAGPWTHADFLGVNFGIAKEFRQEADANRLVYFSNDTTYSRTRNIKVDPATPSTDQRPIYGLDVNAYMSLGRSHKVQGDFSNRVLGAVNLGRYRMYRRLGFTTVVENRGFQAAQRNATLIVVRGRFGGQMELSGAGAMISDGQS